MKRLGLFSYTTIAIIVVIPTGSADDWPQWRGPDRTGIGREQGLVRSWPEDGPPMVWESEHAGVGYSSVVIQDGRLYTQGDLEGVEHIIALDVTDGSVIWAVQSAPVARALDERVTREFRRHDQNQDGTLDEIESLKSIGWSFNEFDRASADDAAEVAAFRTQKMMAEFDNDGDGSLTFAEVGDVVGQEFSRIDRESRAADAEQLAQSRTQEFIDRLDQDGDGQISQQEARQSVLRQQFGRVDRRDPSTGERDGLITPDEILAYLARFEPGKDGVIDADELASYYSRRFPGRDGTLTKDELRGYFGGLRDNQGNGPRGSPTLDEDRVYVEGGKGDVTCLERSSGMTLWHINLVDDFNGRVPGWGYSESPLVVDEKLIVTPGGLDGTMLALDKRTGEVIWQSSDVTEQAHYSSPIVAEIGGIRQVIQFARESVFGVALDDGRLLWKYRDANNRVANCATPVVDGDYVFASSSYEQGGGLARITTRAGVQTAEPQYFLKEMDNHHGGLVKVGDHLYGFGNGALMCIDFHSGDIAWRHRSVGKGSLCVADGLLFLLSERDTVALAEATPDEYRELGRFNIPNAGRPSWAHPVVANGRLYIRNQNTIRCYDISAD